MSISMRVQITLTAAISAIITHLYLAFHYYPLKFGYANAQSLCNLNAKFDCDAVAVSAYSAAFGVPMAVWGAVTNLILAIIVLIGWLEWTEHPERWRRFGVATAFMTLIASVVMGVISLVLMDNYCLFCIILYVLSFVAFFSVKGILREPFFMHFTRDLKSLWGESRGLLGALAAIPILAFLTHAMFQQNLGDSQLDRVVRDALSDWQSAPQQEFVAKPSLAMGPERSAAALVLAEFVDFRCGHCKRAKYSLEAFTKSHPDVRLEFYSFPLDGACNEKVQSSSGISCRLAALVVCAEREGRGWNMQSLLFDRQDTINTIHSVPELDILLAKEVNAMGLSWERMNLCLGESATTDAVKAQAKQGILVNVAGTPTIFANGKLLPRGQLIPVLKAVRAKAME